MGDFGESMEITVVLYEDALKDMLVKLEESKKKGNQSVIIEQGPVSFHVCSALKAGDGE
jgi:intracellular sulfur oxidation DsrE/DsrF family protein